MSILEIAERALGLKYPAGYVFDRPPDGEFLFVEKGSDARYIEPIRLQAWMRDVLGGRRKLGDLARDHIDSRHEAQHSHLLLEFWEALDLSGNLEISDRKANGWKLSLLEDNQFPGEKSEFGMKVHTAANSAGFPHTYSHSRRTERLAEMIVKSQRVLRRGDSSILHWTDAMLLFHSIHDIGQMLVEYDNASRDKDDEYPTKDGHAAEGAIYGWITRGKYQFESQINRHKSERQIAGVMLVTLIHDEPEKFSQRMASKKSADKYWDPVHGSDEDRELFVRAWEEGEINPLSLSLSHILQLSREQKVEAWQKKNLPKLSEWGLDPLFEEEYSLELQDMLFDTRTLEDLLRIEGEDDYNSLINMCEINILADLVDMNTPPAEALMRLLSVKWSQERPWFLTEDSEVMLERVISGPGNVPGDGDSDVRRILWQTLHPATLEGSHLNNSSLVREMQNESNLMLMYMLREIGGAVMNGDLSVFENYYEKRVESLAMKLWKKGGVGWLRRGVARMQLGASILGGGSVVAMSEKIVQDTELIDVFMSLVSAVDSERTTIVNNFRNKPDSDDGEIRLYSPEEIAKFYELIDKCISVYGSQYGLSEKYIEEKKTRVKRRMPPNSIRYTYDSLNTKMPKTWIKPAEVVWAVWNEN